MEHYKLRILEVLNFKGYKGTSNKGETHSITLAYIEEAELIVSILSYLMTAIPEWKTSNTAVYEGFVDVLLCNTLKIFQSNTVLSESFRPRSTFED